MPPVRSMTASIAARSAWTSVDSRGSGPAGVASITRSECANSGDSDTPAGAGRSAAAMEPLLELAQGLERLEDLAARDAEIDQARDLVDADLREPPHLVGRGV